MSVNSVTLDGNLVDDPELVKLESGYVCNFRIANNGLVRGNNVLNGYFDIRVFDGEGTAARNVAATLKKGERVVVTGRLNQQVFEREDGTQGSRIRIIATAVAPSLQFRDIPELQPVRRTQAAPEEAAPETEATETPPTVS